MPDYSRYKTETLEKMCSAAWERYYGETIKPCGSWGDGMRRSKLPEHRAWVKARERYDAICAELKRRGSPGESGHISCVQNTTLDRKDCKTMLEHETIQPVIENKCAGCLHNTGGAVMDCEYACAGVEQIEDEGRVVVSCSDYEPGKEG